MQRRLRGDYGVPRPQYEERAIQFAPLKEPGLVLDHFTPNSNPLRVLKSMLGGESTLSLLREARMAQTAESPSNYTLKPATLTNGLPLQTLVTGLVALIDGFLINTLSSTFPSVSSSTPSHLIKTTNLPLYRWKWAPGFFNRLLKSNTLASLLILIFRCPPTFAIFFGPPSLTCGVLAKPCSVSCPLSRWLCLFSLWWSS